ncbi:hypothetical protein PBI_LARENN_76 [Mycobacterium phage Larenn]|uniref:Uncharacterized protein n=1 Tax=Mycobacterium phage Larenn TaxID=1560285 RepID=A0A0A0RLY3_9CAUD|nr:hypothetical protein PBI_LARENN_76 [Mycobacterium phage Larenn]AIW02971.1 hypothetical protein PBI_LARENN_76 [Mycobacterium phage Larenn]
MRHRAYGRDVIFQRPNGAEEIVARADHPDWAYRIAQALNETDPLPNLEA